MIQNARFNYGGIRDLIMVCWMRNVSMGLIIIASGPPDYFWTVELPMNTRIQQK